MSPHSSRIRTLETYAAIGDRRTCALVGRDGSIDWWCWPRFDSTPVFWRLLDPRGAAWRVAPASPARMLRHYLQDTNVLETTYRTDRGTLRVTDFAPLGAPRDGESRIVRAAECLAGDVDVLCEVGGDLRFAGERPRVNSLEARFRLRAGARRSWLLGSGPGGTLRMEECDPAEALSTTVSAWRRWAGSLDYDGPHRPAVTRSALALALLTDEGTGAVIAAPTTSLPEVPGGVRNWDYRFCWLRDAAMTLEVLMELGRHEEAMSYWGWLGEVASCEDPLRPLYTVDGCAAPAEEEVAAVVGHGGARPVRIGNAAAEQLQLDVLGYVVAAAYRCQDAMGRRHSGLDRVVARLADRAARSFREPDSGLWERRDEARHHLHGKLMCWVALDRALRLAERGWADGDTAAWREAREDVAQMIRQGADPQTGAFGALVGGGPADASALRTAAYGLVGPTDPRVHATLELVDRELSRGPYVYRYREPDGLPGQEGAFLLCSFWRVEALAALGRRQEAEAAFEVLAGCGSDLGLLPEEIDPETGRLLGNYPQAFSHLGLIRAALALAGRPVDSPESSRRKP